MAFFTTLAVDAVDAVHAVQAVPGVQVDPKQLGLAVLSSIGIESSAGSGVDRKPSRLRFERLCFGKASEIP